MTRYDMVEEIATRVHFNEPVKFKVPHAALGRTFSIDGVGPDKSPPADEVVEDENGDAIAIWHDPKPLYLWSIGGVTQ